MNEQCRNYLEKYIELVFKCECAVLDCADGSMKIECQFADGISVNIYENHLGDNNILHTFEEIEYSKFRIAQSIYKELLFMRVRSLCNVELEYFSD